MRQTVTRPHPRRRPRRRHQHRPTFLIWQVHGSTFLIWQVHGSTFLIWQVHGSTFLIWQAHGSTFLTWQATLQTRRSELACFEGLRGREAIAAPQRLAELSALLSEQVQSLSK